MSRHFVPTVALIFLCACSRTDRIDKPVDAEPTVASDVKKPAEARVDDEAKPDATESANAQNVSDAAKIAPVKPRAESQATATNQATGTASAANLQQLIKTLRTCGDLFDRHKSGGEEFNAGLRSVYAQFQEIEVSTEEGKPRWANVSLGKSKTRLDAVRFRSPLDQPADMYWSFSFEGSIGNWYILPVSGEMQGFQSFRTEYDVRSKAVRLTDQNSTVMQQLVGGHIKPGQEYILWFYGKEALPRELGLAITLVPTRSAKEPSRFSEIARTMGIDYQLPAYEGTEDGARRALAQSHSLWKRGATESKSFRIAVAAAASLTPELSIGSDTKPVWHELALNTSATGVVAYRLKFATTQPADMRGILSVPRSVFADWDVVTVDKYLIDDRVLEVDLQLPGAGLPAENQTHLWNCLNGQIQPDGQYILWVAADNRQSWKARLCLSTSAAGSIQAVRAAASVARACGITWPEPVDPGRIKGTMEVCRAIYMSGNDQNGSLNSALRSIAPALPSIDVAAKAPLNWHTITLTPPSPGLGAARFRLPPGASKLFLCFGGPRGLRWHILPMHDEEQTVFYIAGEKDLQLREVNLPEENETTFLLRNFPRGQEQNPEYIFWCTTPNSPAPSDVQFAALVAPEQITSVSTRAQDFTKLMGLHLRGDNNTTGSLLIHEHKDGVAAVSFSPDGSVLASLGRDGTLDVWDVSTKQAKANWIPPSPASGRALAFAADGKSVFAGYEKPVRVLRWNLESGKAETVIDGLGEVGGALALSPDGEFLAVSHAADSNTTDSKFTVWDLKNSKARHTIETAGMSFECLLIDKAGKIFGCGSMVSGANSNEVRFIAAFNAQSGERTGHVKYEKADDTGGMAISQGHGLKAVAMRLDVVKLYDKQGQELPPLNTLREVTGLGYSHDGEQLACGCNDGTVQIWNLQSRRLKRSFHGHYEIVNCVEFSPDGRWLASAGNDAAVRLWDLEFPGNVAQTNSIGMKFVTIPAGQFLMGSPEWGSSQNASKENVPRHKVTISRPFLMSMYEVTVGQFRAFVDATGYKTSAETLGRGHYFNTATKNYEPIPGLMWRNPGFAQDDEHPVVHITFDDATKFCEWLGKKEGKTYRLPTEGEWEYACRAGSTESLSFANSPWHLQHMGNVADQSAQTLPIDPVAPWNDGYAQTAPVGSYIPNSFGLYDMHGNVFEWCSDWYDPRFYSYSPAQDPRGAESGTRRVQRGGSCLHVWPQCRSESRDYDKMDKADSSVGFRPVLELK